MTEYVFVHHLILALLFVAWLVLCYINMFIFFAPLLRRRDFLDPDFGVKASLRLASRKRSNCQVGAEADSEIPELGLDGGRLSVDCELNPLRVAGAAYQVARQYGKQRRERKHRPASSRIVKRKRTQITVDRDYVKSREPEEQDEEDESNQRLEPTSSAVAAGDDDDDDD